MIRNLMQFYSLGICFVASIIAMITISLMINSLIDLTFWETKAYYSPFNCFTYEQNISPNNQLDNWDATQAQRTESQVSTKQAYKWDKKSYIISSLLYEIGWLISTSVFFLIHWNLYKRYKEDYIHSSYKYNSESAIEAKNKSSKDTY